jgi:hypothetical protein
MHQADACQHLLSGEAADGLAGRNAAAGNIVLAVVPEPPLAPRVVGVALDRGGMSGSNIGLCEDQKPAISSCVTGFQPMGGRLPALYHFIPFLIQLLRHVR